MKPKIIEKSNIKNWLTDLSKHFPIIAPIKKNGNFDYKLIEDIEEIAFDFDRTRMSAKNFFFLPEQKLWIASMTNGSPVYIEPEPEPKIIFGLRPCDISALSLFDDVFSEDYYDPYYFNQRDQIVTIGLRCIEECQTGFCGTMQSYNPMNGYDIMLTELPENKYLVEIGTLKGIDIVDQTAKYFAELSPQDKIDMKQAFKNIEEKFKSEISTVGLRSLMDLQIPQELLDKYGDICLSCGQCSFVCPTCWCFNIKEDVGADFNDFGNLDNTARTRTWTSCLYKEFHTVSGNPPHVFKKTNSSRIEAYYNHKLRGITEKYGVMGCVGCGRCLQSCPVGIDPKETLKTVMEVEH
jgi:sulfhydrogenase subunit beta (sulfur reductase)